MPGEKYLTTKDVRDRLNVHRNTVHRMVQDGEFEHAIKTPGGRWRIPESDLKAFIARQRRAGQGGGV